MAAVKKHWYDHIYFETYLRIPFITIQTRILTQAVERLTYDICRLKIQVWKWSWEFQIYKKERF